MLLDILVKREIRFIAVKEDIRSKVMTTFFALFAEVERDLISDAPGSKRSVKR